jgi:hypothetical protein
MQLDICTAGAEHNKHTSRITYFEKCNNQYCSPNLIRVIRSRIMRWAEHVARMGEGRGNVYTGFWWGNLKERDHLKDPGADGRIILR